jgi:hypothetical protein
MYLQHKFNEQSQMATPFATVGIAARTKNIRIGQTANIIYFT